MDIPNGDVPSSCGIKRIIDCKLNASGQQMYKVKWEPTWEPAENLVSCQRLVDEFWSYVNKVKINEEKATEHRKKFPRLEREQTSFNNALDSYKLSSDSKEDIQRLIAQTNSTMVEANLMSPSNVLQASYQNGFGQDLELNKTNKISKTNILKVGTDTTPKSSTVGAASLKYIESFDNPYVKLIVACKICNKEQPLKNVHNWKVHYQIHNDQKPYQCPQCPSAFKRADYLRSHVQSKHNGIKQGKSAKQENMIMKQENVFFKQE